MTTVYRCFYKPIWYLEKIYSKGFSKVSLIVTFFIIYFSSNLYISSEDMFIGLVDTSSMSFLIFISLYFNSLKSFFNFSRLFLKLKILFLHIFFKYSTTICWILYFWYLNWSTLLRYEKNYSNFVLFFIIFFHMYLRCLRIHRVDITKKTKNNRPVKDVKLFLKNKKKKAIILSKNDIQNLPEDRDKGWFELWKVILKYIKRLMLKLHWKRHWNIIEVPWGAVTVEHQSIERLMRTTKKRFFCSKTKVSAL